MQRLRQLMDRSDQSESTILEYIHRQPNPVRYIQYYYQHSNRASHMIYDDVLYFHIPTMVFRTLLKGHFYKDGEVKPIREVVFETSNSSILSIGPLSKHWISAHYSYLMLGKSTGGHLVAFVEEGVPFDQLSIEHIREVYQHLPTPNGYMTGYRESYVLPYGATMWNRYVADESNLRAEDRPDEPVQLTVVSNTL
jgi:hypothetical protein